MRNKLHLSLWGALFVGACSSGGPGTYTSLSYTREAPGDTFESPGTVLSGNESAGSKTGQGSSADPPATSRDGGSITIKEAGTPIEASVIIEAGGPVPEGGSATACEDLQTCCDSLTGFGGHRALLAGASRLLRRLRRCWVRGLPAGRCW